MQHRTDVEAADALRDAYKHILSEIGKVIIGQDEVVKSVLISIFSNGHCLAGWCARSGKNLAGANSCTGARPGF